MEIRLLSFLKIFFTTQKCTIIKESDEEITVTLTKRLDQALMNRPFYWHYMKSLNKQGEPATLTLTTNPNSSTNDAEFIHMGSPRFQQIMKFLQDHHRLINAYETIDTFKNTPLFPWLLINMKIIYKGQHLKEELFSIGINLVNGLMKVNMMDHLAKVKLSQTISDYCHSISPLITVDNGYRRIEEVIINYIKEQDHQWGEAAVQTMQTELAMIDYFFQNRPSKTYETERNNVYERYKPSVTLQTVSGGYVYLSENFHKNVE